VIGRANQAAEAQAGRFTQAGGIGVVLRFGQFYAWESIHSRYMRRMARLRLPALPGPKTAYAPAIAAEDAAAAVVAALAVPSGTWNVSDDEPLTREVFHRALADALGVKTPIGTGTTLLRLNSNTRFYLRSQRSPTDGSRRRPVGLPATLTPAPGGGPWSPRCTLISDASPLRWLIFAVLAPC
jgi:NAD dependent epimerase/dehydratase family enzyme